MKDLAIIIAADREFGQAKILVDLVRENWPGRFYCIVCTPSINAQASLCDCPIDELLITRDLPEKRRLLTAEQFHLYNNMKAMDGIRQGCRSASVSSAPFTLYIGAGAYPFNWTKIQLLLNTMRGERLTFAARGYGFGFYTHNMPLGRLDDHFFIFDNAYARQAELWDFDLVDFLPHKISAQGMLAMLVLSRIGLRRFYHYSEAITEMNSSPFYFDATYDFLCLCESGLPEALIQRLTAYYLRHFGFTSGCHIQALLNRWAADTPKSLWTAVRTKAAWLRLKRLVGVRTGVRSVRDWILMKGPHEVNRVYKDAIWPRSLDRYYRQKLGCDVMASEELKDRVLDTERTEDLPH